MKIWKATAKQGKTGPFWEIRNDIVRMEKFDDISEIKFEAWSF